MKAVDEIIGEGLVHVIKNNRPRYRVTLTLMITEKEIVLLDTGTHMKPKANKVMNRMRRRIIL